MPRPALWSSFRWAARALAVVLLAIGTVVVPAHLTAEASALTAEASATTAPEAAATGDRATGRSAEPAGGTGPGVVIVGVSGLYWTDVDRSTTPTLWRMVTEGSVGSVSVRSANPETCPTDAWLTLSAGRRTLGPAVVGGNDGGTDPGDGSTLVPVDCMPLPQVAGGDPAGEPQAAEVVGWGTLAAPTTEQSGSYGTPGTVGSRLAEAGACATAVGPGAALALADTGGHVARYLASSSELDPAALVACPVTLVDMGAPAYDPPDRQAALGELDALLRQLVDAVPDGWRIVVAGVSDTPVDELGLQVVVDWRAGGGTAGWLTSESTRRPGIVTLADLSATVLSTVGGVVDDLDGSLLVVDSDRRMSPERTVENRRYLTELTTIVPRLLPALLGVVAAAVLVAVGAVLLPRRRVVAGRALVRPGSGPVTRRIVVAVLLLAACTPAGAYLAALSRWWGSSAPTVVATVSTVAAITTVALLAWGLSRILARGPWRLAGVAAGLTWLVLTVDGLTGTILQQGSILGATPTLGARYYGFGNMTFAVYVAAALVLSGALASALSRARRGAAVSAVLAVGLVTVVVDGWPAFGADFGGVLAVVPAFAMLVLAVAGVSLTPRRIGVTAIVTAATVAVVSVVDWLRPGAGSHVGAFVQRVIDGDAVDLILSKAAGAWATVANPAGAVAAVLCVVVCVALAGPVRARPAALQRTYGRWPLLQSVLSSVVVAAVLGAALNDSGIAVAAAVLAAAGTLLAASWCADPWPAPDEPVAGDGAQVAGDGAQVAGDGAQVAGDGAQVRRMPGVILATGGGLVAVLLLVAAAVPGSLVAAGDVTRGSGTGVVSSGDQVVVIATSGVGWQDVSRAETPTLWAMLRDGAAAGGVTPGATGASRRCSSAGWLALSSGRAPVTGEPVDGTWGCAPWGIAPEVGSDGAQVVGWDALASLQATSAFRPRLGTLARSLDTAGACTTAVGLGAALTLADGSGAVERYRSVDAAVADPTDAFACPVTLVDAGAAPDVRATAARGVTVGSRADALLAVDATVRRVLRAVPTDAVVLVVDVGDPAAGRPSLGVGLVDANDQVTLSFLSASSTRWEGVVQLRDLPTTILAAVGEQNPPELTGSPLTSAGRRPSDVATTVDQLAALTVRDHALRSVSGSITTLPLLAAFALLGAAVALGRRRRSDPARAATARRARRAVDALLLVIASMPAGLYLMTTWSWWRADSPTVGMFVSLAVATGTVAGLGALAPWRPAWAGPAVVSGITTAVLTLDALLGTPLHRGSPLGPAVTLGGRYYGFGNPTYSVYVVAMMVTATALATWLLNRGRRRAAALAAAAVAGMALFVDLWPTLGADVGGGLVLVPAGAVVVLAVAGIRMTWQRLALISIAGLAAVGGIGMIDWLRPPEDRSHLGRFVQSVIDGNAWETVARKGGYAVATVTSGPTAWLTLVAVLATALLLWRRARVGAAWFDRVEEQWPLVRPLLLALLVAAVGGAVANDYGVRIATMMMFAAVPLVGMLAVRSIPDDVPPDVGVADGAGAVRSRGASPPSHGPADATERSPR